MATACPFCLVMMRDGIADAAGAGTGREDVQTIDIAELLAASLPTAPAAPPPSGAIPAQFPVGMHGQEGIQP